MGNHLRLGSCRCYYRYFLTFGLMSLLLWLMFYIWVMPLLLWVISYVWAHAAAIMGNVLHLGS